MGSVHSSANIIFHAYYTNAKSIGQRAVQVYQSPGQRFPDDAD